MAANDPLDSPLMKLLMGGGEGLDMKGLQTKMDDALIKFKGLCDDVAEIKKTLHLIKEWEHKAIENVGKTTH